MVTILIQAQVSFDKGRYCRVCGLAKFRENCTKTLIAGWWGVPGVVVPVVLLFNFGEWQNFHNVPAPIEEGTGFSVNMRGDVTAIPSRRSTAGTLDPGKPLLLRWSTYTGPLVFAVLVGGWITFVLLSR